MERALSEASSDSEPICRIWFGTELKDSLDGKLVTPCECKGSLRFVHTNWIETWAKISANISSDSMETLKWELCNAIFKKKRHLLSLKKIIKNLARNFKNHITSHFESFLVMIYMGFLAYRGVSDAKLRYLPYKKKFGRAFATIMIVLYTTALYAQIGCLLKNEMKRLIKFCYIFKDSLFSYKYWDKN